MRRTKLGSEMGQSGGKWIFIVALLIVTSSLYGEVECKSGRGSAGDVGSERIRLKTVDAGIFIGVAKRYESKKGSRSDTSSDVEEVPFSNAIFDSAFDRRGESQVNGSSDPAKSYKTVFEFKGIPYTAEAPVGLRRWQDPQPLVMEQWKAYDATRLKPRCPQWSESAKRVVGSEDCLYLNVYTPRLPVLARRPFLPNAHTVQDTFYQQRHLHPVIVYIHSGGLLQGSGSSYSPHKLLLHEDVLLVTFNYRLGMLGFLYSSSSASSSQDSSGSSSSSSSAHHHPLGNYGLLDQLAALKWVNRYIPQFGGNPNRITISGDVGYLLMSPLSVGLFSGAIWQTGFTSFLNPPANFNSGAKSPPDLFTSVCLKTGCCRNAHNNFTTLPSVSENKQQETTHCLRNRSFKQLMYIQRDLLQVGGNVQFSPVIDAETRDFPVLIQRPEDLLEMGTLIKVPVLLTVNAIEGHDLLWDLERQCPDFNQDRTTLRRCLGEFLHSILWPNELTTQVTHDMFHAIWRFYFPTSSVHSTNHTQLLKLFGDIHAHIAFQKLLDRLSRNSRLQSYAYVFTYEDALNPLQIPKSQRSTRSNLWPWQDTFHLMGGNDDGNIAFPNPNAERYEEMMAKIWASFANYGTPKQAVTEFTNWTRWHRLEPGTLKYYDLKLEPGSMKSNFRSAETLKFWDVTLREVRARAMTENSKSTSRTTLIHIPTALFWLIFVGVFSLVFCLSACLIYFCCLR